MPPKANAQMEGRILKAAERLWRTRGEHGLTLRAVAREAGTTTPTVYKRFRNKQALQVALAEQFKLRLNEECLSAPTLEEVARRYVRFAEQHPNEYRLLSNSWTEVFHPEGPRPLHAWLLSQLASRFGGAPEDYALTVYALFLLSHAAAMLLTVPGDEIAHEEVRENYPRIVDAVLGNPHLFREKSARTRER